MKAKGQVFRDSTHDGFRNSGVGVGETSVAHLRMEETCILSEKEGKGRVDKERERTYIAAHDQTVFLHRWIAAQCADNQVVKSP